MASSGQETDEDISVLGVLYGSQDSSCNDSFNSPRIRNSNIFEKTLPPGVAPEGFVLVDEDVSLVEPIDDKQSPTKSKPILKVMFRDETIARKYRKNIRKFLINLLSSNSKKDSNETAELVLEIWDSDLRKNTPYTDESDGEIDEGSLFTVDTIPTLKDDFDIPTYGQKFKKPLEKPSEGLIEDKEDTCPKLTCFNCLGNHNLRECKEPRNQNNINKHRKEFVSKQGNKNLRYHQDDDQKYGHIVPGQISSNLRKALGLKSNELPGYIYGMRALGYPPGWLEEARLQHSGIALFNSDGVPEEDPDAEQGEIFAHGDRDKYDVDKIIEFPGFNIAMPKGFRDEQSNYWGSTEQIENSKGTMLRKMSGKKADAGYKRKKLKKTVAISTSSDLENSAMEIDCTEESVVETVSIQGLFVPPLPKEDPVNPPEPPPPGEEIIDNESQDESIAESANDSTAPSSPSDSETSSSAQNSLLNTPVPTKTIKIDLGTPVLQSVSPYNRLPSSEKFSKNICDVINFENLPDSTGKYEQMSGLIQTVRKKLSEIHKD